jgi:hypothetical protein
VQAEGLQDDDGNNIYEQECRYEDEMQQKLEEGIHILRFRFPLN